MVRARKRTQQQQLELSCTFVVPQRFVWSTCHVSFLTRVLVCVYACRTPAEQGVQQFLAGKGYAQYARHICRAFAGAQYPEAEWVAALQQMPESSLVELVAAAQRETGA